MPKVARSAISLAAPRSADGWSGEPRARSGRAGSLDQLQVDDAAHADDQAVDGERVEGAGAEVAEQEPHRQVGADAGQDAPHQDLAAYAVAERAHQVRNLQ